MLYLVLATTAYLHGAAQDASAAYSALETDLDLRWPLFVSGPGAGETFWQDITEAVAGEIPDWLYGVLMLNGGGCFEWPGSGRKLTNLGDAQGKVEVITFKNRSVE